MKFVKSLTVLSLSALMSFSAYAETHKQTSKNQQSMKKTQQTQKKTQPAASKQLNGSSQAKKAKAPANTTEQQLKEFSDSLALRFVGIEASQENNQPIVHFKYVAQNKAKRAIKQVHWASIYIFNNQPVLVQDVPFDFKKPLQPKESQALTFSVPFANLPKVAQQALINQNQLLSAQFQAKSITFTNGSKIEVK